MHRRLVHNPLFIQSHHSSATTPGGQSKLSRLDSLQGPEVYSAESYVISQSKCLHWQVGARCCVLGSLVQIEEGSLSLEDPYAVVNCSNLHYNIDSSGCETGYHARQKLWRIFR